MRISAVGAAVPSPEPGSGVTASDARPSSFGEILGRAIAAYGRQFVPLFVILAVLALPIALLEFYAQSGFTRFFEILDQLVTLPPADSIERARLMTELNRAAAPNGWAAAIVACELFVYPLARTALFVFTARALDGAAPAIGAAYRRALPRWLAQVVVVFAFIGIALVIGVAVVIASGVGILAVGAAAVFSRAAALVAGVVTGLAVSAVAVAAVALGNLAWLMASVSIAIEDANPVFAIVRGLQRTFDRPFLRRTFGIALAILAVDWFGAVAIGSIASVVARASHVPVVSAIAAAVARIVLDGAIGVFVVLYTREVMVRREGSDIVGALAADVAAEAEPESADGLDAGDRALIAQYLARRPLLEPRAAAAIAAGIAARVRPKLRASFHYLNDVDLLEHLGR